MTTVQLVSCIAGDLWAVTFKPRNPVEALIGGRTIKVKASSREEAIRKAKRRYTG